MSEDMRDAEGTLMTAIERALHEADDCRAQWPLHPHMWHRISFPTEEMRVLLDAARAELAQHAALVAAVEQRLRVSDRLHRCLAEFPDDATCCAELFEWDDGANESLRAALAVQPAASVARGEGEGA